MRLLQINSMYKNGSTGKICQQIDDAFRKANLGESKILYFWGEKFHEDNVCKCATNYYAKIMALKSRLSGNYGFISRYSSKKVISKIKDFDPDIIHLHNIHDHTVALDLLFEYLKKSRAKIIWTFHDCWAYTGYCAHYSLENCYKWLKNCANCPVYNEYSWIKDNSLIIQKKKKALYGNLKFDIITPSKWLAEETKKSFVGKNNISVIYNGIDLNVFKPTYGKFITEHKLDGKKIILGVAYKWDRRKGFDVFLKLSRLIKQDYMIVLVGNLPAKMVNLPNNIITIERTTNQNELARIYTAANVFVNPTREEVFGLVNIEALACGTPVITFNSGGSPECIDSSCGYVCESNNIKALLNYIELSCESNCFKKEDCIKRASQFEASRMSKNYLDKYIEMSKRK